MRRDKLTHTFIIIFVGLILTLPSIALGFPEITHDSVWHTLWYSNFSRQLWDGDWYPRWLIGMNGGLGSPAFFYYAPLPYYLTSLLYPVFGQDPLGWRQLGISVSVALIASGLFTYLWLRTITSGRSALVASLIYMLMPYHLAVDLYTRGAFAEFWAFVWMPLTMFFTVRIVGGGRFAIVGQAVSYASLIMTHLPTTLLFSLVPICYSIFMSDALARPKIVSKVVGAMILGIGLSAVYLLPAILMQKYVSMEEMRSGVYHYSNWFLFSHSALWGGFTVKLQWMTLFVLIVAICAFLVCQLSSNNKSRKMSRFWMTVVIISLFLMTPLSKIAWQFIHALQSIQFPFRINIILALATTALLALAGTDLRNSYQKLTLSMVGISSILMMGWIGATAWFAWSAFSVTNPVEEPLEVIREVTKLRADPREYRPRWAESMVKGGLKRVLEKISSSDGHTIQARIEGEKGRVTVNKWQPREISLSIETPHNASLVVSQLYYPGWNAYVNNTEARIPVTPSRPDGLLTIPVSEGRQEIILRLDKEWHEHAGQIISLASVFIVLFLLLWAYCGRKRQRVTKSY